MIIIIKRKCKHTYMHTNGNKCARQSLCVGKYIQVVIYKAFCFDVAQGRMNGAPNETRTHSCRFASLAC